MNAVKAVAGGMNKLLACIQTGISVERFEIVRADVERLDEMLDTLKASTVIDENGLHVDFSGVDTGRWKRWRKRTPRARWSIA